MKEREFVDSLWMEVAIYYMIIRPHMFYQWNCATLECAKREQSLASVRWFYENMK